MDSKDLSRRMFVRRMVFFGAASAGTSALLTSCGGGGEQAADMAEEAADTFTCMDTSGLAETDVAMRTTLQYVDISQEEGKNCANCVLYVEAAAGSQCGTCQTVKGPIHPEGYCTIWAPNPV